MFMCCFVFFTGNGDHRDLHVLTHSFPTRRSSDRPRASPTVAQRAGPQGDAPRSGSRHESHGRAATVGPVHRRRATAERQGWLSDPQTQPRPRTAATWTSGTASHSRRSLPLAGSVRPVPVLTLRRGSHPHSPAAHHQPLGNTLAIHAPEPADAAQRTPPHTTHT